MSSEFPIRRSFGKNKNVLVASNLVDVQKKSYAAFLQADLKPEERKLEGLQAIFQEVLSIKDSSNRAQVEFLSYSIEPPKMTEEEAVKKDLTYASPVRVKLRLIRFEGKGSERIVKEVKEQEVYFGDVPLMTDNGSFIINGSYRVIVSQMHKSAGVFFDSENSKTLSAKKIYSAHIVPARGVWLDFDVDQKGVLWVRIDKKRKILLSTFLMLLPGKDETLDQLTHIKGFSNPEILSTFYDSVLFTKCKHGWKFPFLESVWKAGRPIYDLLNPKTGEVIVTAGQKINFKKLKELADLGEIGISSASLVGSYISQEVVLNSYIRTNTSEKTDSKADAGLVPSVILQPGDEITEEHLPLLEEIGQVSCLDIDHVRVGSYLRDTLAIDKNRTRDAALLNLYKVLRPGESATLESAALLFKSILFDVDRYDLSVVGRIKMNARLRKWYDSEPSKDSRILEKQDFIAIVKGLLAVKDCKEDIDDIDHLGFRRVRSVGELVANQYRGAMLKVARSIRDRLNLVEADEDVSLHDFVNSRILVASLREFFGTSQLSQIMDNINALAEISHKRRVTAMGPGGLDSLRASFEVRDVHPTHYGRICAIETPEGQNIGLINYLAMHARIDEYGFIQTPYRVVKDGIISEEIVYLNAQEEEDVAIASSSINIGKKGEIIDELVPCRRYGDYILLSPKEVQYIDVAAGQILSVAASLIPFIENDDPGRALMGSNMQRQAVPLKKAEAPLIGTGVERRVGLDSMSVIVAKRSGVVKNVDSSRIVIQRDDAADKIDVYKLRKFEKSNASSCINQRPVISCGDHVQAGDLLADGSSTDAGEIALGKNLRVAFMSFKGLTFEDSVVISQRLLNDGLTSIHIEEFEISARETRSGSEEVTREIPGISDEFLRNLDEAGVVHLGAKVKTGDILVGRVTPKAEGPSSPEERLLKAMFGERASDVGDSSLRVPAGITGTVVNVQIFSKKGIEKDERSLLIERSEIQKLARDRDAELASVVLNYRKVLYGILMNEIVEQETSVFPKGMILTREILDSCGIDDLLSVKIENRTKQIDVGRVELQLKTSKKEISQSFEKLVKELQTGDDLAPGVLKTVKIFVAMNRIIEAGDKVAGRHGNKGVISRVLPIEDMPFDDKGEPVDIILNPLGVPARMNIGQILETHLGWVSLEIGKKLSTLLGKIYNRKSTFLDLRTMLEKVYPNQVEELAKQSDEYIIDLAVRLASKGVPFASPSFDGAKIEDIKSLLAEWGLPVSGQISLRDGETGECFPRPITVGCMYIKKLNHMVADKIHARSTGSYSLITQQPPGGRAKMGGQRKGEMEIWALEAYGAAYTTRESMTIKSDDHVGRVATYEAITQGYEITNESYYTPEAFKILQTQMKCAGINLESLSQNNDPETCLTKKWIEAPKNTRFDALRISLLDPDQIRKASFGEVKRPETINYRTQKPEPDGLFCASIFGPVKDYECLCGRYKRMKFRGVICERCHVEVTLSRVRRERMGHIELAAPVAHIWFTKILPSRIGMMLDMTSKDLDKVLRFERYAVTKPGATLLEKGQLLTEEEYKNHRKEYGSDSFEAQMGAEALESLLKTINLDGEYIKLKAELENKPQELKRKKLIKRLKLVEGFIKTKTRPEWMILRILPVMPADLRPIVSLDGGRFATSDVNELLRRVINRNNRLKELQSCDFPDVVVRNEKRMLQYIVDALLDNSRLEKPVVGQNGRMFQSIGESLKGKQGLFRQNLLGKRVDYSGRSVIVVGPTLKLHQCGLPKKMALELFKPFVYARLEQYGLATTLRSAKRIVEEQRPEVWDILKEVTYQHPVLLNRAPTLHRLGIQAFECVLIDLHAIQLHPLVCAAFNADFDGDQMSVHLPLSVEAQMEARVLMMATNNILSPAHGRPIMVPSKDMVLGIYYLTSMRKGLKGEGSCLNFDQIEEAVRDDMVDLNAEITAFVDCPKEGRISIKTTAGRVILFNSLPKGHKVPFTAVNRLLPNKEATALFGLVYKTSERKDAVAFADTLMQLGFKYATRSAVSISFNDLVVPAEKGKIIDDTWKKIREYRRQYVDGLITEGERKNKVTDAWYQCDEKVGKAMEQVISAEIPGKPINAIYMMAHSGARGSAAQMRQVLAMRGFIAKTDGEILENAVDRNYAEGLDPHSYYLATHGTRKGFSDMALKTADAGYFTRKLVDVAQDCIITSRDCEKELEDGVDLRESLIGFKHRHITFEAKTHIEGAAFAEAYGRVLAQDVFDPANGHIIFEKDTLLREEHIEKLEKVGVLSIQLRSPITCANEFGICAQCYGMDLSKSALVNVGEPVGIVAAQSIGEPGAQLTLRTFHSGGGAKRTSSDSFISAVCDGEIKFRNVKFVDQGNNNILMISSYGEFSIIDLYGRERSQLRIPYGAKIFVKEGQIVNKGDMICEWDPYIIPRLSDVEAVVKYVDLIEGISLREVVDEASGLVSRIVSDWRKGSSKKATIVPALVFKTPSGESILADDGAELKYKLSPEDVITVEDGARVKQGDLIVKKQKEAALSGDITAGLPRLVELFEARQPKVHAVISEQDGVVALGKDYRAKRCVLVVTPDGIQHEYMLTKDRHVLVQPGDPIRKGDPISDGDISSHDILKVLGVESLVQHLLNSIQNVFKSQGIGVDNKHIECIVRYMMRKVEVMNPGDSVYVAGEQVDRNEFIYALRTVELEKEKPIAIAVLQGISRSASMDPSFIKAASFQEAHKIFVDAALKGQIDPLNGMKQRLITGMLIPAGTGFIPSYWKLQEDEHKQANQVNCESVGE